MSKTRQIKKEIKEWKEKETNIENTSYGSLYKTIMIFRPKYHKDTFAFVRMFERVTLPYEDDKDWFEKTLKALNVDIEDVIGLPIAKVSSKWNTLYMPYVYDTKEEKVVILPIRKDGIYPTTCNHVENIETLDWEEYKKC